MTTIERSSTDTSKSYAALCDYAAMGAGRSLPKLAERYRIGTDPVPSKQLQTLKRWSTEGNWQARVVAYDDAIYAELEAERAAIRRQRRIALEEADWSTGEALRTQALAILDEVPRFIQRTENEIRANGDVVKVITLALSAGPGELARALKTASEIQRLSVGEPTEIHRIVEREIEAFLDLLKSQLTEEEYARIVDLAVTATAPRG